MIEGDYANFGWWADPACRDFAKLVDGYANSCWWADPACRVGLHELDVVQLLRAVGGGRRAIAYQPF